MGRRLIGTMFSLIIAFVPVWSMAGAKPPKKVCLNLPGTAQMILVTKPAGPMVGINDWKFRFIDVLGEVAFTPRFSVPLRGSGHMRADGTFYFEIEGSGYSITEFLGYTVTLQCLWHLSTDKAKWLWIISKRNTMGEESRYLYEGDSYVARMDCYGAELPY